MDAEPAGSFQPAPQLTITSLETLKVFADPLRQQIIEALLDGAKTVKQVAAELDLAPTKLYYHVNLLEEHQLIRVVDTRIVSGIIEKHYQASARSFAIEHSLLTPGQESGSAVELALNAMLDPIREEIQRSFSSGMIDMSEDAPLWHKLKLWRETIRFSEAEAAGFYSRLEALVREYASRSSAAESSDQPYALIIGVYPAQTSSKSNRPLSK
jgi:transposase-like protein